MLPQEVLARQLAHEYHDALQVQGTLRAFARPLIEMDCPGCGMLLYADVAIEDIARRLLQKDGESERLMRGTPARDGTCRLHNDRLVMIWIVLCWFDAESRHNRLDKGKGRQVRDESEPESESESEAEGDDKHHHPDRYQPCAVWTSPTKTFYAGPAPPTPPPPSFPPLGEDDEMTSNVMDCLARLLSLATSRDGFDRVFTAR